MNTIAIVGLACVAIVAIIAYCAIVMAGRADEQSRDQLQGDPGCGADFDGEGHR